MSEITITPLGTVSPYTCGEKNCPGFEVQYNDRKLLLDCGNGISRLVKFPDILNDLSIIITHYHNDHFGDLGAFEYASYVYNSLGLLDKKIDVYLPSNECNFAKKFIISNPYSYSSFHYLYNGYSFKLDDLDVSFYDNKSHSIETYAVKLQNDDFKIIYTSDVGKTNFDELINFCFDSDLIISESTFLLEDNSNSKVHLNAYDAGLLAKMSNSKELILTHFWPEKDTNDYLIEAKQCFDNVSIAKEGKKLVFKN